VDVGEQPLAWRLPGLVNRYIALYRICREQACRRRTSASAHGSEAEFPPDAPRVGRGDGDYAVYVGRLGENLFTEHLIQECTRQTEYCWAKHTERFIDKAKSFCDYGDKSCRFCSPGGEPYFYDEIHLTIEDWSSSGER
jgi:hypothetical protein